MEKEEEGGGAPKRSREGRRERADRPAGAILRASGKDGPQLVRSKGDRWTEEAEDAFLDALAASNNATWAAEQCGFSRAAIYKHARRDPGFVERMAAARAMAHGRIDEALSRAAEDFLEGREPDPDAPIVAMTVQDAISIQKLHLASQRSYGRRPGWPARPRSIDEVRDSILTKLSAIARKNGLL